ncbi:MAG: LacI family DNA-binding transcriptional regulator [Eubacteriales bacterium]|nr:LacI family DNA-binding transcriptional regulator [Eubacteriales bacterium]
MAKKTLSDISKEIGVSTATISRVLTNKSCVKKETKLLVENALVANNYQYSVRRRSIPSELTKIILVITGDVTSYVYTSHIKGISQMTEKEGYKVFIANTDYSAAKEEDYLRFADRNRFSGVIMLNAIETPGLVNALKIIKCPLVMVNRYLHSIDTDIVSIDNFRSGFIGTEYLIENGHKKIAYLGGPENSTTCQDRMRGYMSAMQQNNLPVLHKSIYFGDLRYESGLQYGSKICQMDDTERFTAVYCANDIMATGLVDTLFENDISIPEDFSITCSDNTLSAINGKIKLTTIDYDPVEMGFSAAQLLISRINEPQKKTQKVIYPPVLTKRKSVKKVNG